MNGIEVDEEHLALEVIDSIGPGGNFMTAPHTMKHIRSEYFNGNGVTDRKTGTAGSKKDPWMRVSGPWLLPKSCWLIKLPIFRMKWTGPSVKNFIFCCPGRNEPVIGPKKAAMAIEYIFHLENEKNMDRFCQLCLS